MAGWELVSTGESLHRLGGGEELDHLTARQRQLQVLLLCPGADPPGNRPVLLKESLWREPEAERVLQLWCVCA